MPFDPVDILKYGELGVLAIVLIFVLPKMWDTLKENTRATIRTETKVDALLAAKGIPNPVPQPEGEK